MNMNPLKLLTEFVALNHLELLKEIVTLNPKFFISCTLAGLIAMFIPQTRRSIMLAFRRMARYPRRNLIPYLIIQFIVIFVMVRFFLYINVLSNPPQVVYMMIDAKNGTHTRMNAEDYSSYSSKQSQASGLSGTEFDKARAEAVAAYWAERKFHEELKRAGYPVTTTTDVPMTTFMI